jgi:nucleotide-binding universal stress UspA family protein
VLHPTDFSPASERAFANALAIAVLRRTKLTLLHVAKGRPDWSGFPHVRETLERWDLLEPGSARTDVAAKLDVDVAKVELRGSFTVGAIVRYLDANPHDLIVLATEGETGLPSWFSRSTSEAIVGGAGIPALFVPAGARRGLVALDDGAYTLRRVLVPVTGDPPPEAAVELATRAAVTFGDGTVDVTLLHVGSDDMPWPRTREEAGVRFDRKRAGGRVVESILAEAERSAAELIVMATAGAHGLHEMMHGSTTQQVLRKAGCPLLAVPSPTR